LGSYITQIQFGWVGRLVGGLVGVMKNWFKKINVLAKIDA
jgi:hypothetical protein